MGVVSRAGSSSSDEMASNIRQNYHEECEALINKQINMEMYASYVYLSMASYFSRDDQALHGFAKFFRKSSDEERSPAIMFMDYQNKRGGKCVFQDIASQPRPSGAAPSRPLWQLSSSRRKSTRPSLTFTPLLERGTILIWLTTSKETS